MFNFGNIFSSLLSGPVGNGMRSEADDVKKTRLAQDIREEKIRLVRIGFW